MEGLRALEVHVSTMQDRFRDACRTGDLDVVQDILKNLSEEDMLQLIHQSAYPGYEGHRPFMTGSPMIEAVLASQPAIVDYLASIGYDLEHECDIHVSSPVSILDKCTALCVACACGAVEIARILLLHGANVNHTSHHSSPVIYASECRDVALASLLLEHGADIQTVPRGLKSYAALLPLYQACLNGYKETAELFLHQSRDCISPLKRICFLALLGAQCINRNADFDAGISFWCQALNELHSSMEGTQQNEPDDLIRVFREFHIDCLASSAPSSIRTSPTCKVGHSDSLTAMRHSIIFDGVRLCKTVGELNSLADDHPALVLQALLVLQAILGPSHTETLLQVCHAAKSASEDGDLSRACWLYLYIIECSETHDQTNDATDFSSQLAEMLLNIHCGSNGNSLSSISNVSDFLVSAIDLACCGIIKMHVALYPQPFPINRAKIDASEMKQHPKVRLFTEMVETLMAFLRLFIAIERRGLVQWNRVHQVITNLLSKCRELTPEFSKFSVESEMMKIAVHGDHSALSTLYFFQEDLFPDAEVVKFLLECDASVNCRDFHGDTPLHLAVDCSRPCADVVLLLIDSGAHIDTCNQRGITPASLIQRQTPAVSLHNVVNLFDLVSLRCLAARAVIDAGVEFRGGVVPPLVENFVRLHVAPDITRPGNVSS